MGKTTPVDWLDEGLAVLRTGGEQELTIESLCARLKRTKGAYYHHFRDADAYAAALLAHWEARQTSAPIDVANKGDSAKERRRRLSTFVLGLDMILESAVRAWALRDERARRAVATVDARRIAYLAKLFQDDGAPPARARALAQLEYATFVGAQQIYPSLQDPEAQLLLKTLREALASLKD